MSIARKEKSERKKSNNKINMNERRNIAISRKSKQDKQEQKKVYRYFIFEQKKKKISFLCNVTQCERGLFVLWTVQG